MTRLASCACVVVLGSRDSRRAAEAPLGRSGEVHSSRRPTSWPTYNGDYSGRRFSPLDKINDGERRQR